MCTKSHDTRLDNVTIFHSAHEKNDTAVPVSTAARQCVEREGHELITALGKFFNGVQVLTSSSRRCDVQRLSAFC